MDALRLRFVPPLVAAVVAAATVVLVTLAARPGGGVGPAPPVPVDPMPVPLDRRGLSLDRCAAAIEAAGLSSRYPDRADWQPIVFLFAGGAFVTLLEGEVPFVCVTGPTTVDVSDPESAVRIGTALLLLSTPAGVLAAVAPVGETVEVAPVGGRPPGLAASRYFLRVTAGPITDASQLVTAVGDPAGLRLLGAPERLAQPALHAVDRRSVPADQSTGASALLRHCQAVRTGGTPAPGSWLPAQVLAYGRGDQPASLVVATSRATVGGCSVAPGEITPLRVWRIGTAGTGTRPFGWLPAPGAALPDLGTDVAAGPVEPGVTRMDVTAATGQRWHVSVAGGTFATQLPDGVPPDPRALTVRAFDADDRLLYEGPAVG